MPELPKLSDVEKEYAKQEAADSLLAAVRASPSLTNDPASQAEHLDHLRREAAEAEMVENTKHIEALSGEKLKHCPYCGTPGKASVFSMSNGYFSVLCLTCDARGPKALRTAEAIEKWNNRNFTGG